LGTDSVSKPNSSSFMLLFVKVLHRDCHEGSLKGTQNNSKFYQYCNTIYSVPSGVKPIQNYFIMLVAVGSKVLKTSSIFSKES
jgi:hypothetical protein